MKFQIWLDFFKSLSSGILPTIVNVRDVPFPLNAFLHGWHNGGSQICIFMISLHHVYYHYYLHVMLDVILSMFLNLLVQSCSLIAFLFFVFFSFSFYFC